MTYTKKELIKRQKRYVRFLYIIIFLLLCGIIGVFGYKNISLPMAVEGTIEGIKNVHAFNVEAGQDKDLISIPVDLYNATNVEKVLSSGAELIGQESEKMYSLAEEVVLQPGTKKTAQAMTTDDYGGVSPLLEALKILQIGSKEQDYVYGMVAESDKNKSQSYIVMQKDIEKVSSEIAKNIVYHEIDKSFSGGEGIHSAPAIEIFHDVTVHDSDEVTPLSKRSQDVTIELNLKVVPVDMYDPSNTYQESRLNEQGDESGLGAEFTGVMRRMCDLF